MPVTYTTEPLAPTGLALDTSTAGEIVLTWNDQSSGEDGYYVYRSTDGSNYSQIATKGPNSTQHTDTGLADSTKYWYYVSAYTSGGESNSGTETGVTITFEQASDTVSAICSASESAPISENTTTIHSTPFSIQDTASASEFGRASTTASVKSIEGAAALDSGSVSATSSFYLDDLLVIFDSGSIQTQTHLNAIESSTSIEAPTTLVETTESLTESGTANSSGELLLSDVVALVELADAAQAEELGLSFTVGSVTHSGGSASGAERAKQAVDANLIISDVGVIRSNPNPVPLSADPTITDSSKATEAPTAGVDSALDSSAFATGTESVKKKLSPAQRVADVGSAFESGNAGTDVTFEQRDGADILSELAIRTTANPTEVPTIGTASESAESDTTMLFSASGFGTTIEKSALTGKAAFDVPEHAIGAGGINNIIAVDSTVSLRSIVTLVNSVTSESYRNPSYGSTSSVEYSNDKQNIIYRDT
jgi:hypothetical protein